MGVDSQDELISEIDSHQSRRGGAGAGSDSDDDPGPGPPRSISPSNSSIVSILPANTDNSDTNSNHSNANSNHSNAPQALPEPDIVVEPIIEPLQNLEIQGAVGGEDPQEVRFHRRTPIDRLVDALQVTDNTRELLRAHYNKQQDLDAMNAVADNYRHRITELERQIRHPDPTVRRQAEHQLEEVMDMINNDMADAIESDNSLVLSSPHGDDDTGSYHSGTSLVSRTPSAGSVQPLADVEGNLPFDDPAFGDQAELE